MKHFDFQAIMLASIVLVFAGCGKAVHPTWLPDSSGFVAYRKDGELIHYDLKRKAFRKLVPAYVMPPGRCAVSPDGVMVAAAFAYVGKNYLSTVIEIKRISSGDQLTAKAAQWGDDRTDAKKAEAICYWSANGKHILICCKPSYLGGLPPFAVYDFSTDRLERLDAPPPAYHACIGIGISPIIPDGSGYLSMEYDKGFPVFRLVDWDGNTKPMTMSDEAKSVCRELLTQTADYKTPPPKPPTPSAKWQGNQAILYTRQGVVTLDVAARTISLAPPSPTLSKYWESLDQSAPEGENWYPMQIARFRESLNEIRCWHRTREEDKFQTVFEWVNRRTDERRVLLETSSAARNWDHPFTLAPNGKSVFVHTIEEDTSWFYVFDHEGNQLGRIYGGEIPR